MYNSIESELKNSVDNLFNYLDINDKNNFAHKFYSQYKNLPIREILTRSWIIIRFGTDDKFDLLDSDLSEYLNQVNPIRSTLYQNEYGQMINYSYVLSLMVRNDSVDLDLGRNFILSNEPLHLFYNNSNFDLDVFENFQYMVNYLDNTDKSYWLSWNPSHTNLINAANKLETLLIQNKSLAPNISIKNIPPSQKEFPYEKILHIGSFLKSAEEQRNNLQMSLLMLVVIIEYLLTRNPDHARFNVEESISKQFKIKTVSAVQNQDKHWVISDLNKKLTEIYNQRSYFAHGNYDTKINYKDILDSVKNCTLLIDI